MPVQCPSCQWPAAFSERGPAEDPSILLSGTARIAQAALQIIAIRTSRESGRMPDYRGDVPSGCYEINGLNALLEQVLEDFEYLVTDFGAALGETGSDRIELSTGNYTIVAIPSRANGT